MKTGIIDCLGLALGSVSLAAGVVLFFTQGQIAAGGASGIAIIMNHLAGFSPGLVMAAINLPLMLVGLKQFGKTTLVKTAAAILLTSLSADFFYYMFPDLSITQDRFLNAVIGGVLAGMGIGLMFRSGGTSGGWTMLVRLIAERMHVGVGQVLFALDGLVVAATALAFGELETALYGVVGVFAAGKMVDLIVAGRPNVKSVHISSRNVARLLPRIKEGLCSPGALIRCDSVDSTGSRDVLLLTVKRDQIPTLKKTVMDYEEDAIMIVLDAVEFYGSATV